MVLLALFAAGCTVRPPPPPSAPPADLGAQCLTTLAARGVAFEPAAMPVAGDGCGVVNGVRVSETAIAWNRPAVMSCALALRLDTFESEIVEPLAQRYFHQKVTLVEHYGAFSCRRESTGRDRLSQHALGNAIDIAGFRLADGRKISVEDDWRNDDARGRFLHELAKSACGYFSVVLTPASNAAHYNHLHVDIGPYRLCGGT